MNIEYALALADQLIFEKTNLHLSTLQVEIFRGAWAGQTYEEVAETCSCSITHVKRVGVTLWELLSLSLREKVNKKSFRAALERYDKLKLKLGSTDTNPPVTVIQHFRRSTQKKPKSLPVVSEQHLQFPEGPVEIGSSFYVERPTLETRCYETILKPGGLIRIKAPRQMGKTSLLNRILDYARQHNYQAVSLNLQLVDSNIFLDLERFLQWFCAIVTRKLQLPLNLAEYWDDLFGSKISCKDYFESYLLPQLEQPYHIAHHQMPLEEFLQLAPTEASPYSDHLRRHLLAIKQQPNLVIALKTLLATTESVSLPSQELFQLNCMGLIRLKDNQVTLRCELYRQYFRERL